MTGKAVLSILKEYSVPWAINRELYSIKLKMLNLFPMTETIFEKKTAAPKRTGLFEINVDCLGQFIKNLPEWDKQELLKAGDRACRGQIRGFSSQELDYGWPIEWQLNPTTGKKCDGRKKWYRIPDFDEERGDIKAIWEISRFSHFIVLSRAYILTGNKIYYEAFSEQLKDWLKRNPYSYGANYKCGQECALRMVNALFAYTIFENCGLVTKTDQRNIKELISRCYRKILNNFFYAYRCIKNNHTLSELLGMIIGAWCCGEEERLAYAFRVLDHVIAEQFTEDGGYIQYSFNYERLALQDLEVVLAIGKKTGFSLNKNSQKRLLCAAKLMYQCQDKSGDMPNYGSNDGALVFPLTSCGYRDFRPVINTIYVLLTGEKLYEEGKHEEELIWLGINDAGSIKQKMMERVSCDFRQAGLFTLRNDSSWLMTVLNEYRSRPGHMDQMHIDLWTRGINVLCDVGTFSYADELGKKLELNKSHNTVVCGEKPQMNTEREFLVYDWTRRKIIDYSSDSFCGIMWSKNGYSHKRRITAFRNGYRIWDSIKGGAGEKYEIRFHTPCEVLKENGQVKLMQNGQSVCIIKPHAPFQILEASRSLYYLKEEKIRSIVVMGILKEEKGCIVTEIFIEGV